MARSRSFVGLLAVMLLAMLGGVGPESGVGLESPTYGGNATPWGWGSVAHAQEDMALPFDTAYLVEGFQAIVAGSNSGPYFCYRGNEVESWWEYSRDGTETVEWDSAPVPQEHAGKPVTFAVACGLGSGGGEDSYHELHVNGRKLAAFNTPPKTDATWLGVGVKLLFDYAIADKWDSFGTMYITVSPEALEYGKPVRFKVVGTRADPRSWFMLSAIRDNVAFVMKSFDGQKMAIEYRTPTGKLVVCKEYKTLLGTFVTSIEGSDLTRLTYLCGKEVGPRFSPDGARVLFNSSEGGTMGVWTISATGEDRKRICDGDQGEWLADGKSILFRRDGQVVQRLLDTGQERMVSPPGWKSCAFPSCSPDGLRIAFVAETEGGPAPRSLGEGGSGVFAGPPGEKEPACLVRSETLGAPRWSPDGNKIVYQKEAHIWIADADGGNQYQLTTAGGVQCFPAWSPRGDAVAYCQGPGTEGPWQIYVTSSDRSRTMPISKSGAVSVMTPDWCGEQPRDETTAPVIRPRPRISIWDAGEALGSPPADWQGFLKDRAGWKPLAVGTAAVPDHAGGLVIENEQAVLLLPSTGGPALLISGPGSETAESVEFVLLDEGGNEARQVEALRLVSNDGEEAVVELSARSAGGELIETSWRLPGSRAAVEVTPLRNAGKLRLRARMNLAVVPDRFGNDLLLEPQQYAQGSCFPPSVPLVLGLLEGGSSALALVCPSDGQRAELRTEGDELFGAADVSFANDKIVAVVLTGEGAWHQERPQADGPERVNFGWQMPFPAMWRLAVRGKQERYSAMFCEIESPWFDTKRVFLKKGEPLAEDVELGVIYLYDRRERTPAETITPVDIIQDALGIKRAARILDTEALTTYRTAAGWTTWADLSSTLGSLRHIFSRGLEVQEKVYVEHLCDDVQPFIEGMDQRLAEYESFAKKLEELCTGAEGGAGAQGLIESVRRTWGELSLVLQQMQGLKKATAAAEFCEKIRSLARAKSDESTDECSAAREGIVAVAGEREEMLRSCRTLVREIRDQAGAACLLQPEARAPAEQMRALCREVLRKRYLAEGDWRGEPFEVPPYWLGPRAQDYGWQYYRTMTGRSRWRGGQE